MFGACADRLLYAAQKHVTSHYFPQSRSLTYFKYKTNDSYITIPSSIIRNNKHISVLLSWRSIILCKFIQNFSKLQYKYTQLHWSAFFSLGLGNLKTANLNPCFFLYITCWVKNLYDFVAQTMSPVQIWNLVKNTAI